jgi:hypothetical protein
MMGVHSEPLYGVHAHRKRVDTKENTMRHHQHFDLCSKFSEIQSSDFLRNDSNKLRKKIHHPDS